MGRLAKEDDGLQNVEFSGSGAEVAGSDLPSFPNLASAPPASRLRRLVSSAADVAFVGAAFAFVLVSLVVPMDHINRGK